MSRTEERSSIILDVPQFLGTTLTPHPKSHLSQWLDTITKCWNILITLLSDRSFCNAASVKLRSILRPKLFCSCGVYRQADSEGEWHRKKVQIPGLPAETVQSPRIVECPRIGADKFWRHMETPLRFTLVCKLCGVSSIRQIELKKFLIHSSLNLV